VVCIILALCLVTGLPTIFPRQDFLGDDFGLVTHLHSVSFAKLLSYFGTDWTEGIYGMRLDELRPLLALSYWVDAALWGVINSAGFHVSNVLLHALTSLLVCAITLSIAPANRWAGMIAGGLFAIMPCHAETVAWISGRVDSLAALFYLGTFLCFVRFRLRQSYRFYAGALMLFALGLFVKQSMVTLPFLLMAYDLLSGRASRLIYHVPFIAILAPYLLLRRALFGSALREDLIQSGMVLDFIQRQAFYWKRLLPISIDYSDAAKAVIGFLLMSIVFVLGWWLVSERIAYPGGLRALLFFGPVWYGITISPMVVTYISARHLYITAAGLCIAVALLILPDPERGSRRRIAVFACLVVLYGVATICSVRLWTNNGLYSFRISSDLPAAMRSIPPGSTVLMAIPATLNKAWLWGFAIPFAMREPLVQENLYDRFEIVEPYNVYCCPPQQWWTRLRSVLATPHTNRPVYIVTLDARTRSVRSAPLPLSLTTLRERVESLFSGPTDAAGFTFSRDDAIRVSRALFPEIQEIQ
jgi:hypothetical protein